MRLTAFLLALMLVLAPGSPLGAQAGRIVAIGDIHGSLEGFAGILKAAGLIRQLQQVDRRPDAAHSNRRLHGPRRWHPRRA